MFTIYSADVTGNPGNCSYPHKHVILDEASLKEGMPSKHGALYPRTVGMPC